MTVIYDVPILPKGFLGRYKRRMGHVDGPLQVEEFEIFKRGGEVWSIGVVLSLGEKLDPAVKALINAIDDGTVWDKYRCVARFENSHGSMSEQCMVERRGFYALQR